MNEKKPDREVIDCLFGEVSQPGKNQDQPVSTGSIYRIQPQLLENMVDQAQRGDVSAMVALQKHYRYAQKDSERYTFWLIQAAEADEPVSQYNYAIHLNNIHNRADALIWARKAEKNGHELAAELVGALQEK